MVPPFLTSALDGSESSVSSPCRFTSQGKSPRYPLDMRLGGPQSWRGHCGEEKKISCPHRESNPGPPLDRLSYPDSDHEAVSFSMPLRAHSSPGLASTIVFRNHFSQRVGVLGRGMSPSQSLYLIRGQHKHRINAYTHQTSMS
jgi:hypothetical protein